MPTLASRCDVIADVIWAKSTFTVIISNDLFISDAKMNVSRIFRNFQTGCNFEVRVNFYLEVVPEVEYIIMVVSPIFYILSFRFTF